MTRRVLQVVLSLNPGGTERLVIELATRLNHIAPMAVCCLDDKGAWSAELESKGIPVTALGRAPGFHPRLGRRVAQLARAHRASVVHCHHYSPFVYGALSRFWRLRSRVIFTEHGRLSDQGPSSKRRLANLLLARAAAGVFTVSNELGEHLVAEGFPARSVSTIYNGIKVGPPGNPNQRMETRRGLGIPTETFVIGTIARLDPVKDLGTLLDAMKEVIRTSPALLLVIGDGPERLRLEQAAASLGGSVRFLGHREDARDLLLACDAYVNSSISEGVSLTILEAMAAALPVVATRVGGTPEIVTGSCGSLVAARDAKALGAALGEIRDNPRVAAASGRAASARARELFTIERMVDAYRQVYEAV